MILEKLDSEYIAGRFIEYFSSCSRIDDHMRMRKKERLQSLVPSLPGMEPETMLFSDFDMHPQDMEFEIYQPSPTEFAQMLEITSSACYENSFGKEIKFIVREKNSGKYVGFCRVASPVLNARPRNQWLGQVPDMRIFNRHAVMGFMIVPAQPFGFNYLGGKLLTLLCTTHEFREQFNRKYDIQTCLFETSSLYGSIKSASQYDGLKPFVRYTGDTQSDFVPLFSEAFWWETMEWFSDKNGGKPLFEREGIPSYKMKMQMAMNSIIVNSLSVHNKELCEQFKNAVKDSKENITTKKRFYISTYGYENVKDVLLGKTETLIPGQNFDKHYQDNIIAWWKKKASARYDSLKSDGRLRTNLEFWNSDTIDKIDIIR